MKCAQFLPARKVKEKAKKLKNIITHDILSNTNSTNILAMTFRQVVIQELRNFDLMLFTPGTERDMDSLGKPREVGYSIFSVFYTYLRKLVLFFL